MMNLTERMLVNGLVRAEWETARRGRIGGSDAASFSKKESAHLYARAKLNETFAGNKYTNHGNDRERAILAHFGLEQNLALFRSEGNPRHVCTPDAYVIGGETGEIVLAQVKTSAKPIVKISPAYMRQLQWEMYVMGASRSLFVWEQHTGFQPLEAEPESIPVDRDDAAIDTLITIADLVLEILDETAAFYTEMRDN